MGRRRDRDDELLAALALGLPWRKAAEVAGVSTTTVERRMADPEFRARLDAARADRRADVTGQLTAGTTRMITTLLELASDRMVAPGVRARIALGWLAEQHRRTGQAEVEERLAALERRTDA